MTKSLAKCPACDENLKSGLFGSNSLIDDDKTAIINEYYSEHAIHRCGKCGDGLAVKFINMLMRERRQITDEIWSHLPSIQIVSLQSPLRWDYTVVGLVTAQSTTGTGVFAEFTSSFTDFFGTQSKTYNKKLRDGELMCQSILRKDAFELGGNAILGADIDYAEVGGEKGMLMVCMTGTAVAVVNPEILGEKSVDAFLRLGQLKTRFTHLSQYKLPLGAEENR